MSSATPQAGNLDYFGERTLANLLDWLLTLCLSAILILTTIQLGGVRPETQLLILPLYGVLFFLYGLWLFVNSDKPQKIHPFPLLLLPFLIWASISSSSWSPAPWRGTHELSFLWAAFLFFWVAVNCVRTRAHTWVLIINALLPVGYAMFLGFYQFFQDPTRMAYVFVDYDLELNEEYLGQATGVFADPHSFASFLLVLLPFLMVAGFVQRLPKILRVLSFYIGLIILVGITFAQVYWASIAVLVVIGSVPWFCFKKLNRRLFVSIGGVCVAIAMLLGMFNISPLFSRGLEGVLTEDGEGIRLTLWEESLRLVSENPLIGTGAGSFSFIFEHSESSALPFIPVTPHNDFLMVLSNFGIVGWVLLFFPLGYLILKAIQAWLREPFEVRLKEFEVQVMPSRKFFLSIGLTGALAVSFCAFFNFLIYVPALLLYAVVVISILAKTSMRRSLQLPSFRFSGLCYLLVFTFAGVYFCLKFSPVLQAQALEIQASQRLENLIAQQLSIAGDSALIGQVIELYEEALVSDPENADAWIGLSAAICQLHFGNPSDFRDTGDRAVDAASRSVELCPEYWLSSAQLGVALALSGKGDAAKEALTKAVELAPNSSNAHYYLASYLSSDVLQRELALSHIERALEINPQNQAARRLERKLLIL